MTTGFERRFKGKIATTHIYANGLVSGSVATNLTATGSTAAGALVLIAQDNFVATVTAGTGVMLASLQPGQKQRIWDRTGTLALTVYAPSGYTIDGTAGTTGVALTAPKAVEFIAQSSTAIISAALGAATS